MLREEAVPMLLPDRRVQYTKTEQAHARGKALKAA